MMSNAHLIAVAMNKFYCFRVAIAFSRPHILRGAFLLGSFGGRYKLFCAAATVGGSDEPSHSESN